MASKGFRTIPPEPGEELGFWGRRNARIEAANHVGGDTGPPWHPGVVPNETPPAPGSWIPGESDFANAGYLSRPRGGRS